jgi:hypothetical protein
MRKNFGEFQCMIKACSSLLDIIILSEINIKKEELFLYNLEGYNIYTRTREDRRGGGLLIYTKPELLTEKLNTRGHTSEILHIMTRNFRNPLHILAIYRPPSASKTGFIQELDGILGNIPRTDNIIIIGDININILLNDNITENYKTVLCDRALECVINECTREEILDGQLVTSCLDHVWVRAAGDLRAAGAHMLTCKVSDHYLVGVSISTSAATGTVRPVRNGNGMERRTREVLNNRLVKAELQKVDWSEVYEIQCPKTMYEKIHLIFSTIYNKSKEVKLYNNNRITQPWITGNLENMLIRRDELFKKWKSSPKNVTYRLDYTRFRNLTNKCIYLAKQNHMQTEIKNCENDMRKLWATINKWLGNVKPNLDEVIIKYLCKSKNTSIEAVCTNFAKTFTSEIQNIKHNCNKKFLIRESYVNVSDVSFRYQKVSNTEIENIIDKLSSRKSPGFDGIRCKDLKIIKQSVSPILAKFVNICVSSGTYPELLKKSIIRPIYKQGSHSEYTNYRPIAILSVINKIVEKVIVSQISKYLEKNNIISDTQHGFRRMRSTATALSEFTDEVNEHLNNQKYVLTLYIDFKKAFDTLDHEQLIVAMQECGVRGSALEWIRSYLSNRTLTTVIDGRSGDEAKVIYGVPTGSIYGPVGYIMHVNSMSNVVQNCSTYMYADDTCIVYADRDIKNLEQCVQTDFVNIIKWSHDNGIILNIEKTKCMLIKSPYLRVPSENINIIGHTYDCLHNNQLNCECAGIEFVNKYKYLGLTIDTKFSWANHIDLVCNKLRAIMVKLYSLKNIVNRKIMHTLYHSLAESVISYGLNAYGLTFKTYLDKIYSIQIRIIKNVLVDKNTKMSCKQNYKLLYKRLKILPVHDKVKYLIYLENYGHDRFKTRKKSLRNFRPNTKRRYVEYNTNNYYGQRTRKNMIPKIFNRISPTIEECSSKEIFKKRLKETLLDSIDK